MAKGKYAAKAAHTRASHAEDTARAAQTNLAAANAEIEHLRQQLETERRERSAMILRRADELSAKYIQKAQSDLEELAATHAENNSIVAEAFVEYFRNEGVIPDFWADGILPLLIPDPRQRSAYILANLASDGDAPDPRSVRRHAAEKYAEVVRRKERLQLMTNTGRAKAKRGAGSNRCAPTAESAGE